VRLASISLFAGLALVVGVGLGAPSVLEAQEEVVEYRQSLMQAFRMHMGGVGAAMGDAAPMGHAVHHARAFNGMAQALANAFPTGSEGGRAVAAIWSDRDGFMDRVTAIQTATADLVEAAESGNAEAVSAAMQAVRGTCGACHQTYRDPASQ
jgi:cytochrome c556